LLHFDVTNPQIIANVPNMNRAGVIGFANTQSGTSGALAIRILPVLKTGNASFEVAERWEWLLLFCFPYGLTPGTAASAFENFDPATGILTYLSEDQPYIFSGLLALNSTDDNVNVNVGGVEKSVSYREATDALQALLNVSTEATRTAEAAEAGTDA
jgi:hypothetical protein